MNVFFCAAALLVMTSGAFAADTTVSVGSALGVVLELIVTLLGAPLAAVVGLWIQRLARQIGVEITDADRARLDELVRNGAIYAAHRAGVALDGNWSVDVRAQILADTANYALTYGRDTLKRLKAPVGDAAAMEAIILPRVAMIAEGVAFSGLVPATTSLVPATTKGR